MIVATDTRSPIRELPLPRTCIICRTAQYLGVPMIRADTARVFFCAPCFEYPLHFWAPWSQPDARVKREGGT